MKVDFIAFLCGQSICEWVNTLAFDIPSVANSDTCKEDRVLFITWWQLFKKCCWLWDVNQGTSNQQDILFGEKDLIKKKNHTKSGHWKSEQPLIFLFRVPMRRPSVATVFSLHKITNIKTLDTIGNCQRPVFSLTWCISKFMHEITNLWKFVLNQSSNLRDNNERKKHSCHTKLCAFRWLISRPQVLNLRSQNQTHGKLLLFRKVLHFIGSRFSQCFTLPTSPHYLLTN